MICECACACVCLNHSGYSDRTIVGTKMKARTPVRSFNYLWEMIVVWTKVAVVKVSEVKLILWS